MSFGAAHVEKVESLGAAKAEISIGGGGEGLSRGTWKYRPPPRLLTPNVPINVFPQGGGGRGGDSLGIRPQKKKKKKKKKKTLPPRI